MSNLTPEMRSSVGITVSFNCLTTYSRMFGAILPSPWYGTCSITLSQPYLCRISSNHFMKVKQPVYESSRMSGFGNASPVGPISPPSIIPRSALT